MPSKRARERRRWARLLFAIPTFVRGRDTQGKEFLEFATILNVSAGGVLLVTRKQMHPRSHISLEIPVGPPLAESLETQRKFQARVLRNIPMNGFYSYAAQFKSPLRS